MQKKFMLNYVIIGVLLVWAVWQLIPTFRYEMMSEERKEELRMQGDLEPIQERIIRRGLDLQGGMHLVLEVNVSQLTQNIAQNKSQSYYQFMNQVEEQFTAQTNRDYFDILEEMANAQNFRLARHFPGRGDENSQIVESLRKEAADAVIRAEEIIRNRVDQFGVSEPTIQRQGDRRIIVELAGVTDPERATNLIQSTAQLEFVLLKDPEVVQDAISRIDAVVKKVDPETLKDTTTVEDRVSQDKEVSVEELFGLTENQADTGRDSTALVDETIFKERPFSALLRNLGNDIGVPAENYYAVNQVLQNPEVQRVLPADIRILWSNAPETFTTQDGSQKEFYRLYFVNRDAGLTGEVVTDAQATLGGMDGTNMGQPIVNVSMNSEGAKTWSRMTGANVGKRIAIVLDNKVQIAPVIRDRITGGRTVIEGLTSIEEAKDIEICLKAGALPAPVDIIEKRTIGPSLGADSIRKGTMSALIGLLLVVLFIVIYYRGCGVVAFITLVLNITFVLSILALLRATLTLPGIAGLVLTVGMAVDANVLIFERIREELRKGKTVKASVDNGYSRAIITILDANLTTLIAALVLWQFGTGPIRGFAVVLFWGIIFNFVSGYFISKTILTTVTHGRTLKKLSI
ncbi:MAG: SecD/SecF fusion protein [Candidatus Marinimicrobia bacterium]|jgi:preprotein translocase subunit SecD|nr:SecD/SecF fusion protein [Candidatus Neomarinimicrobiota bacterium]